MNIFLLTETKSGCYLWRGAIPAKYLLRRGHQVQIFEQSSEPPQAPDVMVFYRAHYPEAAKLMAWCKKNSIRTVFDTDDALDLVPPENLNYAGVRARLDLYLTLLGAADVVTTTTETLAAHLRRSNPNVVVIPNAVDPEQWTIQPRQGGARVGWTGSATHFGDLAVALDAVRELQKSHDFTLVLQGICIEPSLQELYQVLRVKQNKAFFETPLGRAIRHFMEKVSAIRYEFHPNVPLEKHPAKVCGLALDIGIAPLTDDPFNRNKSCIKFYEYAMSGAVTVASHVLPYSTEVPFTAKNKRESWKQALATLLETDRDAVWRKERDWVMEHRNIETVVEQWERVLGARRESAVSGGVPTDSPAPAREFSEAYRGPGPASMETEETCLPRP